MKVQDGYEMENVDSLKDTDEPDWLPGDPVTISEEHEVYAGEPGVVMGVARGTGMHANEIVYDVLVEGTSDPERLTADDIC